MLSMLVMLLTGPVLPRQAIADAVTNDTPTLVRALSASRQFSVHGPDPLLPHVIGVFADQVRREWRTQLDLEDSWRDPIVILVRPRRESDAAVPTPHLSVFRTELHLKFQLTWLTPPALNQADLVTALVDVLCQEFANRRRRVGSTAAFQPARLPPWVVEGLAVSVRGPDETLRHLARRALEGGHQQQASTLIEMFSPPADPQEKRLFQANSWFLVEGLIDLPRGRWRLRRFLVECGRGLTPPEAFRVVYADLFPETVSLEKWWALELTQRTRRVVAQNPTIDQTLAAVERVLPTTIQSPANKDPAATATVIPFEDLWRHHESSWIRTAIAEKKLKLGVLRQQTVPTMRPVIELYLEALRWLGEERLNRFRRTARRARQQLDEQRHQARLVGAYLDQMELVHSPGLPGQTVTNFFSTFEELQRHERTRRNPVSDYLDQFEE